MTDLINCNPSDLLSTHPYMRAIFQLNRFDLAAQLPHVVNGAVQKAVDAGLATPLNVVAPIAGDRVVVVDLSTTSAPNWLEPSPDNMHTVRELVSALDVAPFGGWWPNLLTAVYLKSVQAITAAQANDSSRDADRSAGNADADNNDVWAKLGRTVQVLIILLVVVAVIYGMVQLAAAKRAVTA